MGSTAEFRQGFVLRLKEACDSSQTVPPPHKGRQNYIAQHLGLAPEAVSKWFKGVAMPRPDKMERLAEFLGVEQTWLAFGVAPEMDRRERKAHVREVDGAVHLVMGTMLLDGVSCGFPGARDPRADFVDFYATIKGSVHAIHVCLARESSRGDYEVLIPNEYENVYCIGVVPVSRGKFEFVDLSPEVVNQRKVKKAGSYSITFEKGDAGRYVSGPATYPKLRHLSDLV